MQMQNDQGCRVTQQEKMQQSGDVLGILSRLSEDLPRTATPPSIRPGASVRYSIENQFYFFIQ